MSNIELILSREVEFEGSTIHIDTCVDYSKNEFFHKVYVDTDDSHEYLGEFKSLRYAGLLSARFSAAALMGKAYCPTCETTELTEVSEDTYAYLATCGGCYEGGNPIGVDSTKQDAIDSLNINAEFHAS